VVSLDQFLKFSRLGMATHMPLIKKKEDPSMAKQFKYLGIAVLGFFVAFTALPLPLQAKASSDEAKRVQNATEVLTEIMSIPEQSIPEDLMNRAQAIAVIPGVKKGAFGIGGRWGKGLVSQRLANGQWSTPSFIEISGGNFGLQIGFQSTDLVLVFTNRQGFDSLLKGKVTLGADASVAAGPVGRKTAVATDVLLESGIFTYSRSKGLFAGVSLDGSAVTIDDSANRDVYGKEFTAQQILGGHVAANNIVRPFMNALQRYSPAKRIS
jgi:lipid-binding SYLF domain-containing protein